MRFGVLTLPVATIMAAIAVPATAQTDGAKLFAQNCSACHQLTGKGIPGAFPALAGDPFVLGPQKPIAMVLIHGRGGMPSFKADLTNQQIATILTYVRSAWGNHATPIDKAVVASARDGGDLQTTGAALQAH